MLDTSVADLIFLVCAIVGGALLLLTVLLDDILGGLLDVLDFDLGGASLMPILLSFVAMFGIGGLFGTKVLELSGAQASLVGAAFGAAGGALAWGMFRFLYSAETATPFSQTDLVGRDAYVLVTIPATAWGTVSLLVEGTTQQFRATASHDIERGAMVRVTGVAGNGLIVEAVSASADAAPTDPTPPATD